MKRLVAVAFALTIVPMSLSACGTNNVPDKPQASASAMPTNIVPSRTHLYASPQNDLADFIAYMDPNHYMDTTNYRLVSVTQAALMFEAFELADDNPANLKEAQTVLDTGKDYKDYPGIRLVGYELFGPKDDPYRAFTLTNDEDKPGNRTTYSNKTGDFTFKGTPKYDPRVVTRDDLIATAISFESSLSGNDPYVDTAVPKTFSAAERDALFVNYAKVNSKTGPVTFTPQTLGVRLTKFVVTKDGTIEFTLTGDYIEKNNTFTFDPKTMNLADYEE